eukprot:CAMPEP_0197866654 /NCGR_PEP_ID=MMETSP1438-20131217/44332_1 /TAXON_ID=1461541 /ORGANISM="Pterosperma sp., Strain CCMP1384" /LENGTH=331 /DNA_ID=CAMNT_0043485239 /DNA_START=572 /DNA_END=1564 /DNA_ORIENTATION=-
MGDYRQQDAKLAAEGCKRYKVFQVPPPDPSRRVGVNGVTRNIELEIEKHGVKVQSERKTWQKVKDSNPERWWGVLWVKHTIAANSNRQLPTKINVLDDLGRLATVNLKLDRFDGEVGVQTLGYFFGVPWLKDMDGSELSEWMAGQFSMNPKPKVIFDRAITYRAGSPKDNIYTWYARTSCPMSRAEMIKFLKENKAGERPFIFKDVELTVVPTMEQAEEYAVREFQNQQSIRKRDAEEYGRRVVTKFMLQEHIQEVKEKIVSVMGVSKVLRQDVDERKREIFTTCLDEESAMDLIRLTMEGQIDVVSGCKLRSELTVAETPPSKSTWKEQN